MRVEFEPRTLITDATTPGDKIPATGWFRVGRGNLARGGAEFRKFNGNGTTVLLGIETATDPRNPDTGATLLWATGASSDGMKDPDSSWVSLNLADKLYYRFVWRTFVTDGTGWVSIGGGFGEVIDQ